MKSLLVNQNKGMIRPCHRDVILNNSPMRMCLGMSQHSVK